MARDHSSELLIRLEKPGDDGRYPMEATIDGIGLWTGGRVALDSSALEESTSAIEYGRELWASLVDRDSGWPELQDLFSRSWGLGRQTVRLRMMLSVDPAAADLHRIKWELMAPANDAQSVGINVDRPVSRFLPLPQLPEEDTRQGLDFLVAVANPSDLREPLQPIDVEAEIQSLLHVLKSEIEEKRVRLTVLPGRTGLSGPLQSRLAELGCTVASGSSSAANIGEQLTGKNILHLIAHGNFEKDLAILLLEDEQGKRDTPDTNDLIVQWTRNKPRLVFLQSCLSDALDKTLPVAGLGPGFVTQGVPAVIAMRDLVDMRAARIFAATFYRKLFETGEPDVAANAGRNAIYKARSSAWAIPVLYSRLRSGERLLNPDPLLQAIQDLANRWAGSLEVREPFPVEVAMVRDIQVVRRELDQPTCDTRLDAFETALTNLHSDDPQTRITVLLGGRGHAKSAVLKRVMVRLAEDLNSQHAPKPIVVRLSHCSESAVAAVAISEAWERLLKEEGVPYEPDLAREQVQSGPLHLVVDGDDDLGPEELRRTIKKLHAFVKSGKNRSVLISMDQSTFDATMFDSSWTTALLVRELRPKTLEAFLAVKKLKPEVHRRLLGPLSDLAKVPWLLSRILELAQVDPQNLRSRFQVLERIVRGRLAEVAVAPGTSSLARLLMQEMAWQLHYRHANSLSLNETYALLAKVRDKRDFPLDEFRRSILKCRLWVESGPEGVRFAYSAAQAYFAASYLRDLPADERRARLSEVVAGLGRLDHLLRWQEVLVLLAGHLKQPAELIEMLLELGFGEGEHLLLAARCVHEAKAAGAEIPVKLVEQLTDSLIWWSLPQSGLAARTRRREVEALEYLLDDERTWNEEERALSAKIVRHLLRLVLDNVRYETTRLTGGQGGLRRTGHLDYSIVRLTAMSALFQHQTLTQAFLKDPKTKLPNKDPLMNLIRSWEELDVAELKRLLCDGSNTVISGAAAFALATWGSPEAIRCLHDRFFETPVVPDIHWSIIDALADLKADAAFQVIGTAIKDGTNHEPLRHYVAYAIGKVGALADRAGIQYLETCWQSKDAQLQGRAIRSRAEVIAMTLEDPAYLRHTCHLVLQGKYGEAQRRLGIDRPRRMGPWEKLQFTNYVLEALSHIGDESSVAVMREFYLRPAQKRPGPGDQMLRRSGWEMAEKIRLRYHDQRLGPRESEQDGS